MSDKEWNDGYWLEAADRLHITQENIHLHIVDHPAIIKADVQKDIAIALYHLQNAYQKVAAISND